MSEPSGLFAALSAAQGAFGHLDKSARNEFAKYDYVPSDVIIAHAGPILRANGLSIIPDESTFVLAADPKGTKIQGMYTCSWLIAHAGGESVKMSRSIPIPVDRKPVDKLVLGANTELLGYLLRDLFQINRGTGLDVTGREDAEPAPFEPMEMGQQAKIRNIIGDLADALGKDIDDFDAKAFEVASKAFRRKVEGWGQISATDAAHLIKTLEKMLAKAIKATKESK